MKEEIKELIEKTEQLKDYRKITSKINKEIKELTKTIQEWMEQNEKESLIYEGNEITLVEKQINLSFKTENIAEKLEEELQASTEQCQKIAESIVKNKKFMTKKVLKVKSS